MIRYNLFESALVKSRNPVSINRVFLYLLKLLYITFPLSKAVNNPKYMMGYEDFIL